MSGGLAALVSVRALPGGEETGRSHPEHVRVTGKSRFTALAVGRPGFGEAEGLGRGRGGAVGSAVARSPVGGRRSATHQRGTPNGVAGYTAIALVKTAKT